VVVPYSPEYGDPGPAPTDPRLAALAETSGGRTLVDPAQALAPVAGVTRGREVWPWLLLFAALLFPLDVAVRRLKLARADLAAAWAALARRRPGRPTAAGARPIADPRMGGLFTARDRARSRVSPAEGGAAPTPATAGRATPAGVSASPPPAPSTGLEPPPDPASPPPTVPAAQPPDGEPAADTFDRLRAAKHRAGRGRH
jgi:hypothetical protein